MNFWVGCAKIGPGCDNCYAETWATRAGRPGIWGPKAKRERTSDHLWHQPLKWNVASDPARPDLVFTNSLADFWDNRADPVWRVGAIEIMRRTPRLVWLILSKRPGNILDMLPPGGLPRNVALGVTVVNEEELWRDGPKLLDMARHANVATTFFSIEPQLERIDLEPFFREHGSPSWVIAGGESGPGARWIEPDWMRLHRDNCARFAVPFLFKQWGEFAACPLIMAEGIKRERTFQEALRFAKGRSCIHLSSGVSMIRVGKKAAGRMLDGRTHDGFPKAFNRPQAGA